MNSDFDKTESDSFQTRLKVARNLTNDILGNRLFPKIDK